MRSLVDRISSFLVHRTFLVALLFAAIAAGTMVLAPRHKKAAGIDPYFATDSQQRAILDRVNRTFVSDNTVVILYQTDDVFSQRNLERVHALGEKIAALRLPGKEGAPGARIADDIISLTTVLDVDSSEQSFKSVPLVPKPIPADPTVLAGLRDKAKKSHMVRENLISDNDPGVAAMLVRFPVDFGEKERLQSVGAIQGVVAEFGKAQPNLAFHVTGKPTLDLTMMSMMRKDMARFMPVVNLVLGTLLFVFLLRVTSTLIALLAAYLAMQMSFAAFTVLGGVFTSTASRGPVLLATLTVVYLIHFFTEYGQNCAAQPGENRKQVLLRTMRSLLPTSFIAWLTTALGFAVNAWTNIPAIKDFAWAMTLASMTSWLVALLLFPIGAVLAPKRMVHHRGLAMSSRLQGFFTRLADVQQRHPRLILVLCVLMFGGVSAGVYRLEVGFHQVENFAEDVPVRKDNDFMERHVGGSSELIVAISTTQADRFLDPAEQAKLAALEQFMRTEIGANRVLSVADFTKHMHRAFNNNDEASYTIPASPEQIAQLYALNSDLRLYHFITTEHNAVRIVGRINAGHTQDLARYYAELDAYLAREFPASAGYIAQATGQQRTWAEMTNGISDSLTSSLILACFIIFGSVMIYFRSVKTGFASVLPNLLPAFTSLGLMGWLGLRLDTTTVISFSVGIGIAVDDTIHVLESLRERLKVHGNIALAIRETFAIKGPAVVATSLIIAAGFSVLLLSNIHLVSAFGFVVVAGVISALLADLFLLPALLITLDSRLGVEQNARQRTVSVPSFEELFETTSPGRRLPSGA